MGETPMGGDERVAQTAMRQIRDQQVGKTEDWGAGTDFTHRGAAEVARRQLPGLVQRAKDALKGSSSSR